MVQVISDPRVFFYWNTPSLEAENKIMDACLVCHKHAWIGVGISSDGKLKGAEVIIGKPSNHHVRKYKIIGNEWNEIELFAQAEQTLQDAKILQDTYSTTLWFKKLLNEEDEASVKTTGLNHFFFAVGETNDFNTPKKTTEIKLDLSKNIGSAETPSPSPTSIPTPSPTSIPTPSTTTSSRKGKTSNPSLSPTTSPKKSDTPAPVTKKTPSPTTQRKASVPTLAPSMKPSQKTLPKAKIHHEGLSQKERIVIIAGVWAGVLLLVFTVLCCYHRMNTRRERLSAENNDEDQLFLDNDTDLDINRYGTSS